MHAHYQFQSCAILDMVAVCGETTACRALENMRKKMLADKTGRKILKEKPRLSTSTVDMKILKSLPHNTFGRQYVNMLSKYVIKCISLLFDFCEFKIFCCFVRISLLIHVDQLDL